MMPSSLPASSTSLISFADEALEVSAAKDVDGCECGFSNRQLTNAERERVRRDVDQEESLITKKESCREREESTE